MPRSLTAAALVLFLLSAGTAAQAQESDRPAEDPRTLAEEGFGKLMRALRLLLDQIPQYEKPEVTERGDIIIRRKREDSTPRPAPPETGPGGSI